ncbi:hypothetical protein DH2020_001401 [Rehmannia glutinosa]|uniref:LOB domain-containing protein n=1 Tax=Rehmannia glutinosa TaxID=99300 RepID=A0ABR0XZA5_REHGL
MAATGTTGSPCGACKFLRRKCTAECIFAPYFCSEQGPAIFAAIHKVFGASNVSKLLLHVPVSDRCDAVLTIAYEAQSRIRDPIYGCVSHLFALQQQVTYLQGQVMQMKAQLAQNLIDHHSSRIAENINMGTAGIIGSSTFSNFPNYNNYSTSPNEEGLFDSNINGNIARQLGIQSFRDEQVTFQHYSKKRPSQTELSELQELALRMMKN